MAEKKQDTTDTTQQDQPAQGPNVDPNAQSGTPGKKVSDSRGDKTDVVDDDVAKAGEPK